jgi:DNA-directed RNA polymerase subunit RPC12/RpoP
MVKRIVICIMCGRRFEVDEEDIRDNYVCDRCQLKTFKGVKK